MWGVPLEPSQRCSGLEEVQLIWIPPGCSVYELLHNLEPQFRYFKDERLKPAFRLCVGARVQGQAPRSGHPRKGNGNFVVEPEHPGEG